MLSEFVDFANALAQAARAAVMPHFRAGLTADIKSDSSPVSAADIECEKTLREMIRARFPAHGILGEEGDDENINSEFVWVLDPIDGTRAFLSGSPQFCSLIALARRGKPYVGVIDAPALRERFVGVCGADDNGREVRRAIFNGKPCAVVKNAPPLNKAVIGGTTIMELSGAQGKNYAALMRGAGVHRVGGDGCNYGWLAAGWLHAVADGEMAAHDFMAPAAVVLGAGGAICDWRGEALEMGGGKRGVAAAAGGELLAEMAGVLRGETPAPQSGAPPLEKGGS